MILRPGGKRRGSPPPDGRDRPDGARGTHGASGPAGATLPRTTDLRPDALAALHREHYAGLVRLATLVVGDVGVAEQLTQDAFVKLHLRWGGLRKLDRAPAYLRSTVLNGARSHQRRRRVSERYDARRIAAPAVATPESAALGRAEHERVVAALRQLPERQREALALRYYLDLSEAEIAAAMGVSAGSVKTHLHRGLASLARGLGNDRGEDDR